MPSVNTEDKGKTKLSWQEMMEQLKDPALVQAAAAQLGMKVVKEGEKSETTPAEKKLEKPSFEFTEEDLQDTSTLVKKFSQMMGSMLDYVEKSTQSVESKVTSKVKESEQAKLAREVQEFASKHKDFQELLPVIDPLWQTGKYDLPTCYKMAQKAMGKSESRESTQENEEDSTTTDPSTKISEGTQDKSELKSKFKNTKEAARASLEKVLGEMDTETPGEDDEI